MLLIIQVIPLFVPNFASYIGSFREEPKLTYYVRKCAIKVLSAWELFSYGLLILVGIYIQIIKLLHQGWLKF